jgi:hypothetical protein
MNTYCLRGGLLVILAVPIALAAAPRASDGAEDDSRKAAEPAPMAEELPQPAPVAPEQTEQPDDATKRRIAKRSFLLILLRALGVMHT